MAKPKSQTSSKTFPIVITVIVVAMIAVVAFSVMSSKEKVKTESKIQFSEAPTVSAVSIDGKLGESTLPSMDEIVGGADPAAGMIVPQLTADQFSGKPATITPGDKPYVLAFLAHWCSHCRKEVPAIVQLHNDGALPEEVEFVAVATGTDDAKPNYPPSTWLLDEEWPWRKVADDKQFSVATAFGLTGYPYLVFVNADGTVSERMSGEKSDPNVYVVAANKIAQSATK